ncbi:MAG: outer membrane beta-barrel protein, partial [Gloeobacteraceae cyanobacterium ES-bin-316]|nr:outer membrane beta-barrel protein [Ferruginibacter sp.]
MLKGIGKISLLIAFAVVFSLPKNVSAQYFYNENYYNTSLLFELGGSIGAMNSLTDIGGKEGIGGKYFKDLNMGNTEFVAGVYFGALYLDKVGLRLEANFGKVSSFDSVLNNVPVKDISRARYNRNLSFRSNITEISLIAELYPLYAFIDWSMRESDPPRFSPYIMAGIGYFKFNPQANLNGSWVDLQPLSTEGQGFQEYPDRQPYKLSGISIPVGAGVKYDLSPVVNIRAEFLYRPTNTDYLDDVSTTY